MMKIFNLRNIYTVLFIFTAYLFNSCSEDPTYDIVADTTNKVYVKTATSYVNTYKFSLVHTPVSSIGNIKAAFPVRCTHEAQKDIKATFAIDTSLVASYNAANKTSYSKIPDGLVVLEQGVLTISQGAMTSGDSVKVSIPVEMLPQLTKQGYLVPVRITTLEATDNSTISSNQNIVYMVISTSWTNCYNSSLITDVVGTLMTPRTTWTASIDVTLYSGTVTQLFDGSTSTYCRIQPPEKFNLIVNLAAPKTGITGIRIHTNSTSYDLTQVKVYTSSNGTDWVYQGNPALSRASSYQYIKFYQPVSAQYIKIEAVTWNSTSRIYVGEFDVYFN